MPKNKLTKMTKYIPKKKPKKKKVYTAEEKQIKRINTQILRLKRAGIDSYSVRTLRQRLKSIGALTEAGNVFRAYKTLTEQQSRIFFKALDLFEKDLLSSKKGIKQYQKELEELLKGEKQFEKKSEKLAYGIKRLFSLNQMQDFLSKFDPSEVFAFIEEAREKNWNITTFVDRFITNFNTTNDLDTKEMLIDVYNYFVQNRG